MNQLSIIEEIAVVDPVPKNANDSADRTEDSGIANSENSSEQSGNSNKSDRCLIIQFKALNAKPDSVRESTMLAQDGKRKGSCDLSGIGTEMNAQTVNSEDGKSKVVVSVNNSCSRLQR